MAKKEAATAPVSGSILDLNFDDVYEPELWNDGDEVDMVIKRASVAPSKSGKNNVITIVLWDPADSRKAPLTERLTIPSAADHDEDPAKYNNMKLRIQSMVECFGVSTNNVNISAEWPGAGGSVIVRLEEDEQYGKRNSVKKFVVGH